MMVKASKTILWKKLNRTKHILQFSMFLVIVCPSNSNSYPLHYTSGILMV